MSIRYLFIGVLATVVFVAASARIAFAAPTGLTLPEAIQLALQRDPTTHQLQATRQAIRDTAAAADQWPDPKLSAGIVNLPTNSLAVGQDSMTMQVVGLQQDFPVGNTLGLTEKRGNQLAAAQSAVVENHKLEVVLKVRGDWLTLYYDRRALALLRRSEQAFARMVGIARVRYANGEGGEQDLARAKLEQGLLGERVLRLQADTDAAVAALAKWVGGEAAALPLPENLPALPAPPGYDKLLGRLSQHPQLVAANTRIAAAETAADLARQAYKPKWGIALSYGHRPGGNPMTGAPYTDMFSAMVTMSIPIFSRHSKSRGVAAAEDKATAAWDTRDGTQRKLKQMLDTDWARWNWLASIRALYAKTVLPAATLNAQATQSAYRNGSTDFDELVRAEITDLDTRMDRLRVNVDYLVAQANLLYLYGEQP